MHTLAPVPNRLLGVFDEELHLPARERPDLSKVKPNLRQAVLWTVDAWGAVTPQAIINCWRKVAIMPTAWQETNTAADQVNS
jgi:hypothetical protein